MDSDIKYEETFSKAIARMEDVEDESRWISLPRSEKKITAKEIREHMKKRGYT